MKTTFENFLNFLGHANNYLAAEKKTKLAVALDKCIKLNKPAIDEYNDGITDAQVEYAATDEKTKVLLTNPNGSYQYTKDGMKSLTKALRELKYKEIEVKQHFVSELPGELSNEAKEAFEGFVIKPGKKVTA